MYERMKLDKKDKQLLYELDLNSRQSLAQLARKLKLSKQVVDYRLKRLTREGIIDFFFTIVGFTKLGYTQYKVYFKFQNMTLTKEKEYTNFLKSQKNVVWIATCRDKYDLAVTIIAKDVNEFGNILDEITKNYAQYILEKNILLVQYSPIYTKNYLIDSKEKKEIFYAQSPEKRELDKTDKKILRIISVNARMPIIKLMEKTRLTRDIITYRIKKLKKEGLILQFSSKLNLNKINLKLYKVMLRLKNFTPEQENKLKTYCKHQQNCVQFLKLLGNYDVEIEFDVLEDEQIYEILIDLRNNFSDIIRDYNLLLVTKQEKLSFYPF